MKIAEHYLMRCRDCEFDIDEAIELAQKEAYDEARMEMYLNMQYYMEYCLSNKYVTSQEWIEKHKHF